MRQTRLLSLTLLLTVAACAPSVPVEQKPVVETVQTTPETPAVDSTPSHGKGPAGILLYCRHQGEIHVLLANDRLGSRGWGGFGGGDKKGETSAMTAARETHEETRGYFDRMKLFRQISGQQPIRQWGYSLYFAEVSYVPAKTIMDQPLPKLRPAYMETQHYAWIPFSEIEPLLTKRQLVAGDLKLHPRHLQPNSRSDSYWRVWIDNLRQVRLKDGFPWER